MEQTMVFRKLKHLGCTVSFLVLMIGCTSNNPTKHQYQYVEFEIGNSTPIDSMLIKEVSLNKEVKFLEVVDAINTNAGTIEIKENDQGILLKNDNCPNFESVVAFGKKGVRPNNCGDFYPILGETIEWLDKKDVLVNGKRYTVHKFFNVIGNSYLNSSGVLWLEKFGPILFVLIEGRYYKLVGTENESLPWKEILELIMADKDFSELREIPEAPPPPPKY